MISFFLNPILSSEKLWDFYFILKSLSNIYKIWEQKFGINFSLLFALHTYLEERTTVWFRHESKKKTFVKFGGFFQKKLLRCILPPIKNMCQILLQLFTLWLLWLQFKTKNKQTPIYIYNIKTKNKMWCLDLDPKSKV